MSDNDTSANTRQVARGQKAAGQTVAAKTAAKSTVAETTAPATKLAATKLAATTTTATTTTVPPPADPPAASRRQFLIGAGAAGVAGAGAVWVSRYAGGTRLARSAVSGLRAGRGASGRPVWLLAATAGPTDADWTALRNDLSSHKLIRPGESGYTQAKELFEQRFDSLEPSGIAYCRTPADVTTCLSFVTTFKLPVRARSGGHSYAGWSSVTGGLIIDVSLMNSFSYGKGTVTVGTGLDLIHFYDKLAAKGLAVPGGSCPTVGIAGLTLGGGAGVLTRELGLTSDNLRSVRMVLADGSVQDCDSANNSDLYWACRGGGGGNFGVATSFTFNTHNLKELVLFFLVWPWSHAAKVVDAWQSWVPTRPDALWSNMHLSAPFGGAPGISVGGTYVGSASAATGHVNDLIKRVGSGPTTNFLRLETYLNVMLVEAGCSTIPLNACHTGSGGSLSRVPSYAKSDFFSKKLDAAGISAVVSGIERLAHIRGASGGAGTLAFDACGGAMNRVSPTATAFVHRDSLFLGQYSTVWNWPGSTSGVANQRDWLSSYYKSVHPHANGQAYQNYVDPDLSDWEHAYYGQNYDRLTQVKAKYDPANLFTFPQSIKPA
jgi:FAD/FMN-containing dehydrogenase